MRWSSGGRRLCISLHLQSFKSADLLCDVVTTHHTEGVCVFLTHLQQVNWWDFTSRRCSPCSSPAIGWALFRLTRLQSDRLMRRTPHTHAHIDMLTHTSYLHVQVWIQGQIGASWNDTETLSCRRSASFVYVNIMSIVVVELWRWSARPCEVRRGKRRADMCW